MHLYDKSTFSVLCQGFMEMEQPWFNFVFKIYASYLVSPAPTIEITSECHPLTSNPLLHSSISFFFFLFSQSTDNYYLLIACLKSKGFISLMECSVFIYVHGKCLKYFSFRKIIHVNWEIILIIFIYIWLIYVLDE